ncbi:unnamed protein product [Cunninghamella blakesleeana]
MKDIQLYVWGPALGAISIDPRCITIEAYLRVLNLEYTVVHANNPQTSPTGELPLLKHGSVWIAGMDCILTYLSKQGQDANSELFPDQKADYQAYKALAQDRLYDCMLFAWYSDSTNFIKVIRPTYAKLLSFPSRYLIPIQLKKNAKARLLKYDVEIISDDVTLPENEHEEMKELQRTGWHHMYRLARETYRVLNERLEGQDYFFGYNPTTLDCIAFGFLSLHYYPDLPHNRLKHILTEEYPRLAHFCDRFKETYFSNTDSILSKPAENIPSFWRTIITHPGSLLGSIKDDVTSYISNDNDDGNNDDNDDSQQQSKKKTPEELEFQKKRIWSIAGGVTFLLAYVIFNGIVSVDIVDDDDDEY